jgi:hypothetical protein
MFLLFVDNERETLCSGSNHLVETDCAVDSIIWTALFPRFANPLNPTVDNTIPVIMPTMNLLID